MYISIPEAEEKSGFKERERSQRLACGNEGEDGIEGPGKAVRSEIVSRLLAAFKIFVFILKSTRLLRENCSWKSYTKNNRKTDSK